MPRTSEGSPWAPWLATLPAEGLDGSAFGTPVDVLAKTHGDTATPTLIGRLIGTAAGTGVKANVPTKQAQSAPFKI